MILAHQEISLPLQIQATHEFIKLYNIQVQLTFFLYYIVLSKF